MVESWDEVYSSEGNNHKNIYPDVEIIRFLAKNFPLSNCSKKILDLGCGWGNNLNLLKDKKFDYYGIDYSKVAVNHCKKVHKNVYHGDISKMLFEDNYFDAAFDRCSIQHNAFDKIKLISKEIYRVLKPGGLFYSTIVSSRSPNYDFETTYFNKSMLASVFSMFKIIELDFMKNSFSNENILSSHWCILLKKPVMELRA